MNKMDNKTCTVCNFEKDIHCFLKKYSECKDCKLKRVVKPYYDNKGKYQFNKNYIM